MGETLISPRELADNLGVPLKTVYEWRRTSTGPRGIRVGRHIRYRLEDVEAWLERQSDPRPAA